eukprot:scaffold1130_cov195-Pinguiococcus_pyrenoidosus.AAC.71
MGRGTKDSLVPLNVQRGFVQRGFVQRYDSVSFEASRSSNLAFTFCSLPCELHTMVRFGKGDFYGRIVGTLCVIVLCNSTCAYFAGPCSTAAADRRYGKGQG